jgi:hypothetical protein
MKKLFVIFMAVLAIASCTSKGGQQSAAQAHADSLAADSANVITDSLNYVRQTIIDAMAATYPEFTLIAMAIRQDSTIYKGSLSFTFLRNGEEVYSEQEFETNERGIINKLHNTKYALYKDLKAAEQKK